MTAALDLRPEPWMDSALCAQVDQELFFPEKGGSTREAKKICTGCEVRGECLEYALERGERFGIWGGHSERERRRMQHGLPPTAPPKLVCGTASGASRHYKRGEQPCEPCLDAQRERKRHRRQTQGLAS